MLELSAHLCIFSVKTVSSWRRKVRSLPLLELQHLSQCLLLSLVKKVSSLFLLPLSAMEDWRIDCLSNIHATLPHRHPHPALASTPSLPFPQQNPDCVYISVFQGSQGKLTPSHIVYYNYVNPLPLALG